MHRKTQKRIDSVLSKMPDSDRDTALLNQMMSLLDEAAKARELDAKKQGEFHVPISTPLGGGVMV